MHFVLLNQYYPPDVAPTGRYLKELAEALLERGHQVDIVCSKDQYAAKGRRSRLKKAIGFFCFYLQAYSRLRRMKPAPDVVLALTTPPFVGWVAQRALRGRTTRLAHWVMDLYPDVMLADEMIKERSALHRLLSWISGTSFAGSPCVMVLGPGMEERLRLLCPKPPPIKVLPLWSDLEPAPMPSDPASACCFQYAGNMGWGHDMGEFLDAAKLLAGEEGLCWVFSGEGPRKTEVEEFARQHPELPIVIQDYVAREKLRDHLCSGDVHLVSMLSAWEGCILPSKLQAAFTLGRPVLFVGPVHSTPARWIREAAAGWVVDPAGGDDIAVAVREALDPEERERRGRAARVFAEQHFDRTVNCGKICTWLEAL